MIGQILYLEAEAQGVRATGIGCFFDDPVHDLLGLPDDAFQSLYHFTVGGPRDDERLATRAAYHHLEARTVHVSSEGTLRENGRKLLKTKRR